MSCEKPLTPVLEASNISFSYNKVKVLDNVSLSLNAGEMVALLGKNGVGKTTLLRCLTGFLKIQNGEIKWCGKNLKEIPIKQLARTVAFVDSEDWESIPFSIEELVLLSRSPNSDFWGNFSEYDRNKVDEILEMFGLFNMKERKFAEISKGEQQRTKLAMAWAQETKAILMDEPTSHLDPFYQKETLHFMYNLTRKSNTSILAIIHDINFVRFFDRVLFLSDGMIKIQATQQEAISIETLNSIFGEDVFEIVPHVSIPVGIIKKQTSCS